MAGKKRNKHAAAVSRNNRNRNFSEAFMVLSQCSGSLLAGVYQENRAIPYGSRRTVHAARLVSARSNRQSAIP
jgi:hypothetical protein